MLLLPSFFECCCWYYFLNTLLTSFFEYRCWYSFLNIVVDILLNVVADILLRVRFDVFLNATVEPLLWTSEWLCYKILEMRCSVTKCDEVVGGRSFTGGGLLVSVEERHLQPPLAGDLSRRSCFNSYLDKIPSQCGLPRHPCAIADPIFNLTFRCCLPADLQD